jgi:[ribosomal protein S5]-alanine N-acetyltransferase
MNLEINTQRLILKPANLEHTEKLFELMSNHVDTTYLSWEPHKNIETTKELIKNLTEAQSQDKGFHWCIFNEGQLIGIASLIDVRRNIRTWMLNKAELSYWIGTPYTSNGFATEASKAIMEFGFKNLSLHKIIIAHAVNNSESRRICEKLNFKQYAHEHDAFMKDNKWHDLIWYELIN